MKVKGGEVRQLLCIICPWNFPRDAPHLLRPARFPPVCRAWDANGTHVLPRRNRKANACKGCATKNLKERQQKKLKNYQFFFSDQYFKFSFGGVLLSRTPYE